MTTRPSTAFLNYLHNFRALAILFIVAGHCLDAFDWPQRKQLFGLLSFIYKNGTLLFVFISGFLFQHLSGRFNYRHYLLTKLKYVVLPYVIVSVPAIVLLTFVVHRPELDDRFYGHSWVWQVLYFLSTGSHITAFWFIPMISIYYVASPLFIWVDAHPRAYYVIPLLLLVSVLVPRGETLMVNCVHFLSVYVLGMWLSRNKELMIPRLAHRLPSLMVLFATTVLAYVVSANVQIQVYGLTYVSKLALCLLLLGALFRFDDAVGRRGDFLASISFGIFFVHSYNIQAVRYATTGEVMATLPWAGSIFHHLLLFAVIVVACSAQIRVTQRFLGKYSRNVIGC